MSYSLVSIVLPIYNQAEHVEAIVSQYSEYLSRVKTPHELLLVPNGCRDNSVQICHEMARKLPSVRVVEGKKPGWGAAVRAGLAEARGDLLCYTNSARTTAQDIVTLLFYALSNPGTVIKANRKIRDALVRRLGSLLYNLECRALFDINWWDINGTPKFFPRKLEGLLALKKDDDLIDLEFNWICRTEEYPILEVPIFASRRHGGRSTTSFLSAFRMYIGAFRFWRETRKVPRG